MRNRLRLRALSLALSTVGAAGLVGCVGTGASVEVEESDAGAASAPTPSDPSAFALLGPSAAFVAHDPSAPLEEAILPEGTFTLGYVPEPVMIPQPPLDRPLHLLTAALPSAFDLRTTGKLSPIRDQGQCGSCWTFATYASSESGLLPGEKDDFSEDHLNNMHGFDIAPCNGGNAFMSMAYLARWSGPIAEKDAPYTGAVHTLSTTLPVQKHLAEALVFPDKTGPLDNDTIKNAVTTYGAVYTTMSWVTADWKGATNGYYNPGGSQVNHAVAIVGWNDDVPTTTFAAAPAGKGAFLIRNSWGTSFGDGGYFYASYYDAFVGKGNVAFEAFDATSDYDAVYQYDAYGQTSALGYASGTSVSANVFTAQAETNLQAVSFYTTAPGAQVTLSVYDAPTGDPSTGTLAGKKVSAQPIAGYHTVSLADLAVKLHVGRKFSVIVSVTTTQKQSYVAVEVPFAGYSSKVKAAVGTGFVSGDGKTWTDTAKTWKANVPIKAFVAKPPSCDDGNACTADAWTGTACAHTPLAKGTVCRASAGVCDVAETCDGKGAACPADAAAPAGTACRASAGVCDVAETCDGKTKTCPADGWLGAGTVCRPSAGDCDVAEVCSGKAAACPADGWKTLGTVCRAAAGACDVAETCSGTTAACPADALRPKGYVCSASPKLSCTGTAKTCK